MIKTTPTTVNAAGKPISAAGQRLLQRRAEEAKRRDMADRGKDAEATVKTILDGLNKKHLTFAFERLPDARQAGGRMPAQISDYMCWWFRDQKDRLCMPLEVKSIEHDFRLPKANLDQLPRLNKSHLAGTFPVVLVHFKKVDLWRIAPSHYFKVGETSWDMRDLPTFGSAAAALNSTDLFPQVTK